MDIEFIEVVAAAMLLSSVSFIAGAVWASRRVSDLEYQLWEAVRYRDKYKRERDYYREQLPKRDSKGRFI